MTSHSSSPSANDVFSISNGRGTCYGDSGGSAIVKQPDGSYVQVVYFILVQLLLSVFDQVFYSYFQVGILSFGALAGCEKGYPSGQVSIPSMML